MSRIAKSFTLREVRDLVLKQNKDYDHAEEVKGLQINNDPFGGSGDDIDDDTYLITVWKES